MALACVDLSSSDLHLSASLVRQACLDCGFFYIVNHGIDQAFMEAVFEESRKFFCLPLSEKMKVVRNEKHRGYTPYRDETLDPENQSKGDSKEGYYIGVEVPETDPRSSRPFTGPNQWPSTDLLPVWRETMEKYHAEALRVGKKVAKLIALALNLEADFFDSPGILDEPNALVRLLHYSGEQSDQDSGVYGAGAHSDFGLLTLLATDSVPGLQICRKKDALLRIWEDVPPIRGSFIVNLGDMLERWSNGIFRSTLHRVMTCGLERYSIAFFLDPNNDCLVKCLETCISTINPPRFPPIFVGDYLRQRYGDTHADLTHYDPPSTEVEKVIG